MKDSNGRIIFGLFLCIFFVGWIAATVFAGISFDREVTGHLKRAADANTVELAAKEMDTVIKYLESHGMTEGYTSIVYKTPDEDVGFWYNNLKASTEELKKVDSKTSQLEKSNILMKLRETLLDSNDKGKTVVTEPAGIAKFPHNGTYCFLGIIFGILFIVGFVMFLLEIA